jgi:type II secretory pathway pseudopilin PulG
VVLVIISILLSLLFPAVQHARESARRTVCQNNVRQLTFAMEQFLEVYKQVPVRPANTIGGWSIDIMPFMEHEDFANKLLQNPSLNPVTISPSAKYRLPNLTCPSAYDGDSTIPTVPVAHYAAYVGFKRDGWTVFDVPLGTRIPWVVSPELPFPNKQIGPHTGGYHISSAFGGTVFFQRND